jgi:hypothetical protein
VIGFHDVIGVSLGDVPGRRLEIIDDARIDQCLVGGDFDRGWSDPQRAGEEHPCRGRIPTGRDQHVDDLAVLINCSVEVCPSAGDSHVGLIHEPAITTSVAGRASGVDEL